MMSNLGIHEFDRLYLFSVRPYVQIASHTGIQCHLCPVTRVPLRLESFYNSAYRLPGTDNMDGIQKIPYRISSWCASTRSIRHIQVHLLHRQHNENNIEASHQPSTAYRSYRQRGEAA